MLSVNHRSQPRIQFKGLVFVFLLAIFFICTFIFVNLAEELKEKDIFQFDMAIIQAVQSSISEMNTQVLTVITEIGSVKGNMIIIVLISLLLLFRKHFVSTLFLILTTASGGLANHYLKWLFQRARPTINPLVQENGFSFPSGHSMSSFILYGVIMILVTRLTKSWILRVLTYLFCISMIFFIGYSRIYLGVHYPSDVLAGYAAGGAWLAIFATIFRYVEFRRTNRS